MQFEGSITYNGHEMDEFIPVRTAAYVPQDDVHIGEMTVRETLDFSARVQGAGFRAGEYCRVCSLFWRGGASEWVGNGCVEFRHGP